MKMCSGVEVAFTKYWYGALANSIEAQSIIHAGLPESYFEGDVFSSYHLQVLSYI